MLTNQAVGIKMSFIQPEVVGVVISFALHAARAPAVVQGTCLTPHDRIVVNNWRDRAHLSGFDRMVIHDRDEGDACEVGNFLSVYRSGQAWSRWGFARDGGRVRAWCCLTGADVGEFSCMGDALDHVLGSVSATPGKPGLPTQPLVSNLIPMTRGYGKSLGSAA